MSIMSGVFTDFLGKYDELIKNHVSSISSLLNDDIYKGISFEYQNRNNEERENTLNVFKLISDLYRRENFHSDIIRFFLDPNGEHKEGNKFLFSFIDALNLLFGKQIQKRDYLNAIVEREQGRIDIWVKSNDSRHCIIIENKLNNASDMLRQLPRYYDFVIQSGYIPDAIAYIPLDESKTLDMTGWTNEDIENVIPLVCLMPGYCKMGRSLVTDWIAPCSLLTQNLDCISTLRQYGELIKSLTNNNMDSVILSKFYSALKENKSQETAVSVKNMLLELPTYMADRLVEIFNITAGDYRVWKYKPNFCGILFQRGNAQYKIDIWTSEKGYGVYVFAQNENGRQIDWADNMKSLESFVRTSKEYSKTDFSFYEEEKVIACVNEIIAEMQVILVNMTK